MVSATGLTLRGTLGGVLAASVIVIVGWQAGQSHASASTSSTSTSSTSTGGYKDGTYTGTSEQTQYGNVQVKVTVNGGRITDVTALQLADREPRSVEISNQAAPLLREEVLKADSAKVDYVSGATYTSQGYLASVQSALDQAG